MRDIQISKSNMKKATRVECKFVFLVDDGLAIGKIRDAIKDAVAKRDWVFPDRILMSSIQMCSGNERSSSVAVVILAKMDVGELDAITDDMEAEDKAFLTNIVEALDGDNPKIYYTVKS